MFVSFVILPYVAIDMAFVIISELSAAGLKSELKIEPILIETAAHYTATGPGISLVLRVGRTRLYYRMGKHSSAPNL